MGFAEGFSSGAAGARSVVDTLYNAYDQRYKQQVQADNLDQIAQAKAERDYAQSERNVIASAAQSDPNAPPAPSAPPPAAAPANFAQSSIQPIGGDASTTDASTADPGSAVASPVVAPSVAVRALGQPVAPIDPNASPVDPSVPAQATVRASGINLDPSQYSSQFGDTSSSLGAPPPAAPAPPPADARPLWRQQTDGYEAGAKFAAQSGRMGRAAELAQEAAATRVRAASQQADTGLRQFMAGGGPDGLISAFNIIDDGITAKSITEVPGGIQVTQIGDNGRPELKTVPAVRLQGTTAKGGVIDTTIARDQLPQMVAQYFAPQPAYQKTLSTIAGRVNEQFATNESIRKELASEDAKTRGALLLKQQEQQGAMPKLESVKQGDGQPDRPYLITPNQGGGYTVGDLNGTGGAQASPGLSKQDEYQLTAINKYGYQGLESTMQMMQPADKARVEKRVGLGQNVYLANRGDPHIGPMSPQQALDVSDAALNYETLSAAAAAGTKLQDLKAKNSGLASLVSEDDVKSGRSVSDVLSDALKSGKVAPMVTRQGPNGQTVKSITFKGQEYALSNLPVSRPAAAPAQGDASTAPGAPGAPASPSAAAARSPAAAFNSDPTVAASAAPAAAQARETDRVRVLQDEAPAINARIANATTPEDKARAQGDLAALTSEIARAGGQVAAARAAPVAATPVVVPPAVAARAPVDKATGAPPPTATAARVTPATPAAASQASATGTIATPVASPAEVAKDTARLAQLNQQIAMVQVRAATNGGAPPAALITERDAIRARLSGVQQAWDATDRKTPSALATAALNRSPLMARSSRLQ